MRVCEGGKEVCYVDTTELKNMDLIYIFVIESVTSLLARLSVGRLVGWLVRHDILKRAGSYTSMLLYKHLLY